MKSALLALALLLLAGPALADPSLMPDCYDERGLWVPSPDCCPNDGFCLPLAITKDPEPIDGLVAGVKITPVKPFPYNSVYVTRPWACDATECDDETEAWCNDNDHDVGSNVLDATYRELANGIGNCNGICPDGYMIIIEEDCAQSDHWIGLEWIPHQRQTVVGDGSGRWWYEVWTPGGLVIWLGVSDTPDPTGMDLCEGTGGVWRDGVCLLGVR